MIRFSALAVIVPDVNAHRPTQWNEPDLAFSRELTVTWPAGRSAHAAQAHVRGALPLGPARFNVATR